MKGLFMIAHVVLIKFKDKANANEAKRRLDTLPAHIPQIKHFEVGIDELNSGRSYHLSIYSQFESFETLGIYMVHPVHNEVSAFVDEMSEVVHTVDYTVSD
jgi:hypothetical protein